MTHGSSILATIGVTLGAIGTYLLLPHRHGAAKTRTVYAAGGVLAGLGLLGFLAVLTPQVPSPFSQLAEFISGTAFYVFAAGAIGTAVMSVTSRNPVYSALWFTGVIISTSGLFLLADAQFLAAGTIIVYAGAIIVTFLFVIMLAQMEGRAVYDRSARSPGYAVLTSFLLLWSLAYCLASIKGTQRADAPLGSTTNDHLRRGRELTGFYQKGGQADARLVLEKTLRPTSSLFVDGDAARPKPNVAGLGESLYTDHLLTVELAGSILFVALIAAVMIANPNPKPIGSATAPRAGS